MMDRRTNLNPSLYLQIRARLKEQDGVLPLNSEEALAYWVTVLQRHAAECEFGTNSEPLLDAPQLIVLGFSKVDFLTDDPRNILDETWSPIELRTE
jgi:hypothetical protein